MSLPPTSQLNAIGDGPIPAGALDGVTILRYAHIFRRRVSGGVEQYLKQLDRGLLERHRLTILQMFLTEDPGENSIETENVGRGRILWIPVPLRYATPSLKELPARMRFVFSGTYDWYRHQGASGSRAAFLSTRSIFGHYGMHLRHRLAVLSDRLVPLLTAQNVDLMVLHWLPYDTWALMSCALKAGIPFAVVNHFDNARLSLPGSREQISRASAIGVVSNRNIPANLQGRCINLSDAVDTDFFNPERTSQTGSPKSPIVLLPARIDRGKGHLDLMRAAQILFARKRELTLCFAGAIDSEPVQKELLRLAAEQRWEGRILLPGELSAEKMRDLYAMSSVVALPSASEGLGRVLIEAQAMGKPVVAYDSGGVSEAFLPDKSGFLVKAGDVEGLADKLELLLENDERRLQMGECGREWVAHNFSLPALLCRHEHFYLRALKKSGREMPALEHEPALNAH